MSEEITIPFQPRWQNKMLRGEKACTSRTKKYCNTLDTFKSFGVIFRILSVNRYPLNVVANNLYKEEGCKSPEEFKEIWLKLHPRKGWVPNQEVWVHFFRKEG